MKATHHAQKTAARLVSWLLLLVALWPSATRASAEDAFRLRLAAANLTSGNTQSYDPGHGLRVLQGIDADVIMLQEFNYGTNSSAAIRGMVDANFGADWSFYRESGAQIPNGIISRFPILASGEWDDPRVTNRDFAWARIDLPGTIDLWAVSVHFLTASSGERNLEAQSLLGFIRANVPVDDFLVVGGDFNTDARSEQAFTTLAQIAVTSGPHPADQNGNTNTNASRSKPYDGVYPDADLHAHAAGVLMGTTVYPHGLVVDTRVFTPLADIAPAQAGDSAATGMQHMAVVRDYVIPLPEPGSAFFLVSVCFWATARRWRQERRSTGEPPVGCNRR